MFNKILFIISLLILSFMAYLTITPEHQWVGWLFFLVALGFVFVKPLFSHNILKLVVFIAVFLALRYWFFRTFYTMQLSQVKDFAAALPLYLAESFTIALLINTMITNLFPRKRVAPKVKTYPSIIVFIPTYNEDISVITPTLIAATQLAYPKDKVTIYLLDDGGTLQKQNDAKQNVEARARYQNLKELCQKLGVTYLTRTKNELAKAGNMNSAYSGNSFTDIVYKDDIACGGQPITIKGELLLILDCDHIPTQEFLANTVGFFEQDAKVFLVQTPHFFANVNGMEKNLQLTGPLPGENDMFYFRILKSLDNLEAAFFCGSAAVLRCSHLTEAHGFSGNTITEDTATSLALHAKGYRSVFYGKPMVCGLAAETFTAFIIQRMRWAQGSTQILILKSILLRKGLKLKQKIGYMFSFFYWFFGITQLIYFTAPLLFLLWGLKIYNASLWQILMFCFPFFFCTLLVNNYNFGRYRLSFYNQVLEMLQGFFIAVAVLTTFINPHKPKFKVTPKDLPLDKDSISPLAPVFYTMLVVNILAIISGILLYRQGRQNFEPFLIVGFWFVYNLLTLFICFGVLFERKLTDAVTYFEAQQKATLMLDGQAFDIDITHLGKEGFYYKGPVLKTGVAAVINAQDSYGNPHKLKVMLNGAKAIFINESFDDLKNIVAFVYGDGQRWEYVCSRRWAGKQSVLSSVCFLTVRGWHGVRDSIKYIWGKV